MAEEKLSLMEKEKLRFQKVGCVCVCTSVCVCACLCVRGRNAFLLLRKRDIKVCSVYRVIGEGSYFPVCMQLKEGDVFTAESDHLLLEFL